MDLDTTKTKDSHENIIRKFNEEDVDVLIGTQMVTKGHHFPKAIFSCVLFADQMLNIESYKSSENTFKNIVQAIGRAGREEKGTALIQTYNPEDNIIELSKKRKL